jgi:hypothetical protein
MIRLCKALKTLKRILFVVPTSVYKDMKKQPYVSSGRNPHNIDECNVRNEVKEVEQWALELPIDL